MEEQMNNQSNLIEQELQANFSTKLECLMELIYKICSKINNEEILKISKTSPNQKSKKIMELILNFKIDLEQYIQKTLQQNSQFLSGLLKQKTKNSQTKRILEKSISQSISSHLQIQQEQHRQSNELLESKLIQQAEQIKLLKQNQMNDYNKQEKSPTNCMKDILQSKLYDNNNQQTFQKVKELEQLVDTCKATNYNFQKIIENQKDEILILKNDKEALNKNLMGMRQFSNNSIDLNEHKKTDNIHLKILDQLRLENHEFIQKIQENKRNLKQMEDQQKSDKILIQTLQNDKQELIVQNEEITQELEQANIKNEYQIFARQKSPSVHMNNNRSKMNQSNQDIQDEKIKKQKYIQIFKNLKCQIETLKGQMQSIKNIISLKVNNIQSLLERYNVDKDKIIDEILNNKFPYHKGPSKSKKLTSSEKSQKSLNESSKSIVENLNLIQELTKKDKQINELLEEKKSLEESYEQKLRDLNQQLQKNQVENQKKRQLDLKQTIDERQLENLKQTIDVQQMQDKNKKVPTKDGQKQEKQINASYRLNKSEDLVNYNEKNNNISINIQNNQDILINQNYNNLDIINDEIVRTKKFKKHTQHSDKNATTKNQQQYAGILNKKLSLRDIENINFLEKKIESQEIKDKIQRFRKSIHSPRSMQKKNDSSFQNLEISSKLDKCLTSKKFKKK